MSYKTKLKIGAFSQLMQVSVKTLRFYEQKGLLQPHEVAEWTGYRFYSVDQMQKLNAIREFRRLNRLQRPFVIWRSMGWNWLASPVPPILMVSGIKRIQRSGSLSFKYLFFDLYGGLSMIVYD